MTNIDKHRILHVVATAHGGLRFGDDGRAFSTTESDLRMFTGRVNENAPIARLIASYLADVNVKFFPSFWIGFGVPNIIGGKAWAGILVPEGVENIYNFIVTKVLRDLEQFI